MQTISSKVPSNVNNHRWLEIVEILSVLGSIGGSIASLVTQQVVFASIPLSLAVSLNLLNRRQLVSMTQSHPTVAQLLQENVATEAKLGTLTEQLTEVRQLTTTLGQRAGNLEEHTQLLERNQAEVAQHLRENVATQQAKVAEVQQLMADLSQSTSHLQNHTQLLRKGQTKIAKIVGWLREIEACTQTIRSHPNAETYCKRGLIYQHLGEPEGAIGDYSEAIRLNSSYTAAYQARGLVRVTLGNKQGAVEDLREAAKLFFEEGDIANYQKARALSQKLHELSSQPIADTFKLVAVDCLFS